MGKCYSFSLVGSLLTKLIFKNLYLHCLLNMQTGTKTSLCLDEKSILFKCLFGFIKTFIEMKMIANSFFLQIKADFGTTVWLMLFNVLLAVPHKA